MVHKASPTLNSGLNLANLEAEKGLFGTPSWATTQLILSSTAGTLLS